MRRRVAWLSIALLAGCSHTAKPSDDDVPVHTWKGPAEAPPDLPDAPGRGELYANCLICHSASYVSHQPSFPRKTWEAEVAKMKKVYGAPISDESAPKIVDYLVAAKGATAL